MVQQGVPEAMGAEAQGDARMMVNAEEMIRRINIHEALKILAWKIGMYNRMCSVFVKVKVDGRYVYANPEKKYAFESEFMPMLEEICGDRLGDNPNLPDHPIRRWQA